MYHQDPHFTALFGASNINGGTIPRYNLLNLFFRSHAITQKQTEQISSAKEHPGRDDDKEKEPAALTLP
jgi:hypothetical protein